MEGNKISFPSSQTGEEAPGQTASQVQLRWFSTIGILEIRLRWLAALGVLGATWLASSALNVPLPLLPLYVIGLCILGYNAFFWQYLERSFSYPSRIRASGYRYNALVEFYWRNLERDSASRASSFDRFVKIQTSLDWVAMVLLVHFSGGVESPLLFFFVFHLIIASILLSRQACYFFATLAAVAVGALAILEYAGIVPHVSLGFSTAPLFQNGLYVAAILFFFTISLYISVFLATSLTHNLRQKDEELLRLQRRLDSAYQQIQTLYQVTSTVSSTLDLDEVLNLIARNAAEAMQVRACTIRLLDETRQTVETVAAYGLGEQFLQKGSIDIEKSLLTRQILSSGKPAVVSDTSRDTRLQYPDELVAEGIGSILYVPLVIRGRGEGVVGVYSTELDHFTEADTEFLSGLASESATAIANARAYQALAVADKAKSDFVRMVTHEFRSPLSAVQSMLRLMEQGYVGPLAEKQQDLIGRSRRRIAFMLALVGDLLELAAGKMELLTVEKKEISLRDIVTKVTDLMQPSAEEKGLRFEVDMPQESLALVGLEDGLERVIMNLVSNAVKYTPPGGSVAVRVWSENDHIKLEVSDTGIGIPQEALPRIFTEFYRAKNARAMHVEGTGLGLVIAKDVVEEHGGQISAQSAVGKGSTFCVTLPKT
jgi:signal transduction histidine kinase